MRRTVSLLMAAIMVVSLAGMAGVVVADDEAGDEADPDVAPGERMTGVINVVDAEIEGEIAERGFGISVAQAATEDAQAEVVAERLENVSERLDELEERKQELDDAREAGNISQGQYAAEMAKLETERATVERLSNQSAVVAGNLSTEILEAHGINVENIQLLSERANELSGEEVSAIAQDIAGPSVAEPLPDEAQDRVPEEAGPPEDPGVDDEADEEADDGEDNAREADDNPEAAE